MANLTKRSVFVIGDGGLAVTVPKSWATFNNLKAKDKLIGISDGVLLYVPKKMAKNKRALAQMLKRFEIK